MGASHLFTGNKIRYPKSKAELIHTPYTAETRKNTYKGVLLKLSP
uniref:Uncharacterized protein n=1 Tax=Anguilla anguilla TaxID=7936 RepID=A0A0E9WJC5_ANGAN